MNGGLTIKFKLAAGQNVASTVRIGITTAFGAARPKVQVNGWTSGNPAATGQPNSRTLTVGTYRGNNALFSFNVPAGALVVGENTLYVTAISGSGGTGYLSPGYSFDAIDLIKTP